MIEPYINFNGNCEQAMKLYEKIFGSTDSKILRYGAVPPHPDFSIPEDQRNLVMHGEMTIDGTMFNFSDTPEYYVHGNTMSIAIKIESEDEVKRIYEGLKDGAEIHQDLCPTFFSPLYAYLTDKFGLTWQIVCMKK